MAAPMVASPAAPLAAEKRKDVKEILNLLEVDLEKTTRLECTEILERLRVYTTDLNGLDLVLTKRGISIICRYGFDSTSPTTSRIALRCLCNILFLAEPTRQMFVDENYLKEATEWMKNDYLEDEFLSARLLLLSTYNTNLNFGLLFEKYCIAEIINTNISHHAKLITSTAEVSLLPVTAISACSESLKLLYNLTAHCPHQAYLFFESLLPILKMLHNVPIPSPPLQPPVSWLINSLVHLDLEDKEARHSTQNPLFPQFDGNLNVDRLACILDLAVRAYDDEEMDNQGSPLVQVLLRIAEFAPPGPKAFLRARLLPSDQDRERVFGKGDSLSARLLRLSAAPMAPHLRELVPALLFELSDKDVKQFVRNVGYGFAAGFLVSKGMQLPPNTLESWSTGDINDNNTDHSRDMSHTEEVEVDNWNSTRASTESFQVNPITGQRLEMEPKLHVPEMTDEEKEREAERLFVLFERLRATGVIDVENPVTQAVREGRFEEVD